MKKAKKPYDDKKLEEYTQTTVGVFWSWGTCHKGAILFG